MRRVAAIVLAGLLLVPTVAAQDPNPSVDQWTDASWDMTFQTLDRIRFQGVIHVHQTVFEGEVRTADEIRDLHDDAQAAGNHEQFHDDAEATVRKRTKARLQDMVPSGQATVHNVNLVNESLEDAGGTDRYHPAVDFEINATVDVVLNPSGPDDATRQKLNDALRMGATMPLDLDLSAQPGRNQTFSITLAPGVRTLRDVGTPIVVDIDNWKGDTEKIRQVPITVTGADATVYREQQGGVTVTVDLHDLSVDVLSGSGTVQADLRAVAEIGAVEVPSEMRKELPDRVRLNAVGADGLRLALKEGYITEGALDQARQRFANRSEAAVQKAFGPDVDVDVRFDNATVQGGIQGENDAQPPVRLVATAQAQRTFNAYGGGQALVVTTLEQRFPVSAFSPFNTTYRIVLPQGLTAENVQAQGPAEASQTTVDGREAAHVEMSGDAGDSEVAMTIGVTLTGLLAASPLLMAIVVLIVLLIVLLVIYVIWRILGDDEEREGRRERRDEPQDAGSGDGGDGGAGTEEDASTDGDDGGGSRAG